MINPATAATVNAIVVDLEDEEDELDELEPTAFTKAETSLSHETSVYNLNLELIAAAMASIPDAMLELQAALNGKIIDARGMIASNGKQHPQSLVLVRLYTTLRNKVIFNIQNPSLANWSEFVCHNVTTSSYMGKLSLVDQIQALSAGGFGIFSKPLAGYAYISANREGWILHIHNGQDIQTIPVMPEQLSRLLLKASSDKRNRETFQDAPWVRPGVMWNSSNFDGYTMVVTPRKDATHVPIANIDGEVFQFSEIRLSCSYWHYVALLKLTIAARFPDKRVAQEPEFIQLRKLAEKHFGDPLHLPANAAELEFTRYFVSVASNPRTDYFQPKKMLAEYEPKDLETIEAFLPKYNRVVAARVAQSRARRNDPYVLAEPVTIPEGEEEHVF